MESRNNPYLAPNHAIDAESGSRRGSVLGLVGKILLTSVWTIVLFFGSAMILGFASGIYFAMTSSSAGAPSQQTMEWIGFVWAVVPMFMGAIGVVLGVLGYLPGTRWRKRSRSDTLSSEAGR
ncbi:hypothetical protein [Stieleria neptunia]|uniref:hypothetical protein n=1 Tax=Stieleria neptunia TaxID=2527979 RepID=UPI0011AB21A2|nr:hypothetical protein [Stieleria neptunia]